MNHSTVDWNDASAFIAVAETLSFTRAADRLGVNPSALSKRVRAFEQSLGTDLLRRTTRTVAITEAGVRVLEHTKRAIAELNAARVDVQALNSQPSGTLNVAATLGYASQVLMPLVARFIALYPALNIVFSLSEPARDVLAPNIDVLVKTTRDPPPDTVARELLRFSWRLVAAPAYLQQVAPIESPEDLARCRGVMFSQAWLNAKFRHIRTRRLRTVIIDRFLIVNGNEAALNATLHGAGVGLVPGYLADAPLQSGLLRPVLPDWRLIHAPAGSIYAITRRARVPDLKTSLFIRFLAEQTSLAHRAAQ